ncbi:cytosine-purine permease [Crucibulum laeve]|uniref:Cytosine-purine permease n=1 Tax=Crucibulum laeve TaxID=68775 RepID=A0A5C3LY76_9AGAR|nr:cytosine-purine permease [Crucibulum laeve]
MKAKEILSSEFWILEPEASTYAPTNRWSNKDMDPVPTYLRTWSTWNYITYWISDAMNIPAWELASSMLAIGLSWREALAAIAIGHSIIAIVILANGTIGARLHVPFPVLVRSSFGFWFSYFGVISRVFVSMFWFSIQSYTGSECVYQMLKAIWPSIAQLPNLLPKSSNITTVGIMCYFLFWLIQFPFMLISPQKIRHLFVVKAVIVPVAWIGILIWSVVEVPVSESLSSKHTTLSGNDLNWAWLRSINSALGVWLTLAVNIPDFTRYAKTEKAQFVQVLIIPPAFTLVGFIGIAVTSAGQVLYGETLWDPLKLIDRWDNRAATFFVSFSFVVATLGTNISANSLSAANDMTVLFPRYINIRRGQIICAVLAGWVLCPWEILASAPGFISFMSGYTIFLAPFAAMYYWLVHNVNVDVAEMYNPRGIYHYWNGINWRAVIAIVVSVSPSLPGLINSLRPNSISVGNVVHIFDLGFLYGFSSASLVYWVLSFLFPAQETFVQKSRIIRKSPEEIDIASNSSDPKEGNGTPV